MTLTISEKSGSFFILESKTIMLASKDEELSIDVKTEKGFKFKLAFKFIERDDPGLDMAYEGKNGVIIFYCTNFNTPIGAGTNTPIEIAVIDEKKVYIHFWSYLLGGKTRRFDYTILGEG